MDGQTPDNALRVGSAKVVVKPAMLVLLCALVIGAIAIPVLRRDPTSGMPSYGYANPETWKFEARQGAQAVAAGGLESQIPKDAATSAVVDASRGFTVNVSQAGPTPDSVYLRNAMNLDLNKDRKPLLLTFEARTVDPKTPAFPLTFTVRDAQTLLWSERVMTEPDWKQYEKKITLKPGSLLNVIMAIHLGEKTGTVQIRNLQVKDGS
jgi:hypothetical protein